MGKNRVPFVTHGVHVWNTQVYICKAIQYEEMHHTDRIALFKFLTL